jgi:hypothetical protein
MDVYRYLQRQDRHDDKVADWLGAGSELRERAKADAADRRGAQQL